jgi:hypothetical protein
MKVEERTHFQILKRVGWVLVAVGLIDIAWMVYCIAHSISYSSSFNIFAVVAGIFLVRGSLRAASVVRWFSVFTLSAFLALLVAWPFMQPVSLTFTQVRLNPGAFVAQVLFTTLLIGLLYWIVTELGREPVRAAFLGAGRKQRDMRVPAAFGVGLVVVLGILLAFMMRSESGKRAMSIAQQQVGPGYRFHVSSIQIRKNNRGTFVSGCVTAWNDKEVRYVPVHWEE